MNYYMNSNTILKIIYVITRDLNKKQKWIWMSENKTSHLIKQFPNLFIYFVFFYYYYGNKFRSMSANTHAAPVGKQN